MYSEFLDLSFISDVVDSFIDVVDQMISVDVSITPGVLILHWLMWAHH